MDVKQSKLCQVEGMFDSLERDTSQIKRPTLKRWTILLLYCLNTGNEMLQWIQLPAVTTQAAKFFDVDNYVINFSSTIFMISFLILSWPACFVVDKIGLRKSVLAAVFGASLGATIKWVSCHSSNISLLLLGEVIVSVSTQITFCISPRLVAVWFPDHQVSLGQSVCILGGDLGIALGFVVPHWFLGDAGTVLAIGMGLRSMYFWTIVVSCSLLVLNLLAFDEAPPNPPGEARAKQIELEQQKKIHSLGEDSSTSLANNVMILFRQILELLKNKDLMLVACLYGLAMGRSDAILTLMDQTMRPLYPGNGSVVGITGGLIIMAGGAGLPIWGKVLDKWRAYKTLNIILTIATLLSLTSLAYASMYIKSIPLVYLTAILFGTFQSGFTVTNIELAIELTYPAPQLVTYSLLNVIVSISGPACILLGSFIVDTFGPLAANIFYLSTLLLGFICIFCINERLKRQQAIREGELNG